MSFIPLDDRDGVIWQDGKLVPWRDAKIHVLTHGLHYASAVFEGERIYNGQVFKLEEHTERLIRSAEILGFSIPFSKEEINQATKDVIKAQKLQEGYVRPIAWRGSEMLGIWSSKSLIHLAIAAWEWSWPLPAEVRAKGIRMNISQWRRPPPECAPTASKAAGLYMICTLTKQASDQAGFHDALMLDWRGQIAEGTGANIFLCIDGALHTPKPDCFLDGITRRTVMELARQRQIPVIERVIFPDELKKAQEVFLTGTLAEILPVSEIDGYYFKPGAMTEALSLDYQKLVRDNNHPLPPR